MKKVFSGVMLALILTSFSTLDHNVQPNTSKDNPASKGTNTLVLRFDFALPTVSKGHGEDSVDISGLPKYGAPSEPVLPFKLVKALIPQGKEVESISVGAEGRAILEGVFNVEFGKTPVPTSSNVTVEDKPSQKVYESLNPFPGALYSLESKQYLRGREILLLKLQPVQYIPKSGELAYFQRMTVTINLKATEETSPLFRNRPEDTALVQDIVDNSPEIETYTRTADAQQASVTDLTSSYEYVIITNNALSSSFQPLINWKTSKGISAKTVLIEDILKDPKYNSDGLFGDGNGSPKFNDTQAHIRNFIKDAYSNWDTQYVLLGGDDETIPSRGVYSYAGVYTSYNIPCDMYYGALDGSWDKDNDTIFGEAVYHWNGPENGTAGEEADFFAEVYVGRATVDTPLEAENFVAKTLAYEHSPQADYLKKALVIGQRLDDVTQGANSKDLVTDIIPQYTTTRLYDRDGTFGKAAVITELNSGTHIVNHDGHASYSGVMGLTRSDVDSLANTAYFMVYSVGCYSAAFDETTSGQDEAIAEHFLIGSHGAFAYIGNSRYGWYCPASTDGPGERYDRSFFSVLNSGVRNLGKALQLSKEQEPLLDRWTYFTLNLLGDPETEIVTPINTPTAHFTTKTDLLTPPRIGGTVNLPGTARRGTATGAAFSNYTIEFGNGTNPAAWMTNGINLAGNGQSEVVNGTLATWNTSQIADGNYTLRLSVFGSGLVGTDKWIVTVSHNTTPVYIKADGSINPPTAPIQQNGEVYILTSNVTSDGDGIIIERDNMILDGAGYSVQGSVGEGVGICLLGRKNVTIKNIGVKSHLYGIYLERSSNNSISRSTTDGNTLGIWLLSSAGNNIIENNVTNNYYGISLMSNSGNNSVIGNNIIANTGTYGSGVYLYVSSDNMFYHNIFIDNKIQQNSQIYDAAWDCADPGLVSPSINTWDNGYPSGGNYWNDYEGTDLLKGVYQNETGSDGIGDIAYVIDASVTLALNNKDRYPLMSVQAHDIAVSNMTTSKTVVGVGYNVSIKTWVKNEGSFTETINVTIEASRVVYENIAEFTNITLTSGNITTISCEWNTTGRLLGNYTVSAHAWSVTSEIHTADNNFTSWVVIAIVGDITGPDGWPDGKCDMRDIGKVARLFGADYPDTRYDPNADVVYDQKIDMKDVGTVARHFGDTAP